MDTEKKPTVDEIYSIWNNKQLISGDFASKKKRVVDQYGIDTIRDHVTSFAAHCAARGVEPSLDVILEWLYSEKGLNERDDFVPIEKLMSMVGKSQIYPLLIMEVLDYCLKVERAAIAVNEQLGHLSENFKSLEKLKEVLSIREKKTENEVRN